MKIKLLCIGLAIALAVFDSALAAPTLEPLPNEPKAAHLSAALMARYHYRHIALDDALSAQVFDAYLKALDGQKMIFLQSDVDRYAAARTRLDDAIVAEDLQVPFAMFNLYQQRMTERIEYARSLLKQGFDFTKKESYQIDRKDAAWPQSTAELNDLWRKRVKNEWLRLKLAGKDSKAITTVLDKRYQNALRGLSQLKSEDAFQTFMNAYAMTMDPHTNYFGVRASEDFDISMRLSLVGIGAVLYEKDDYTTIRELLPGGAAAASGKLKPGDRIVGVGQGVNGPIEDIVGWRIDDAVAVIRGGENTVVVLDVLPAEADADGKHKVIQLVRRKITLAEQSASKSVIEVKDGGGVTRRIGVITLPGFYEDFAARERGDKDYKSASRDVAALLAELKKQRVDGVLVDLRNDGGGALDEAVALTGLFIDKGPVVQERDSHGQVFVKSDTDSGAVWTGPMGVLINHASASASEIFAAAIQDYGRGVIIGTPSFGKGTVQTVVNLDALAKNPKPEFGELKMTVAEFFRINGGSTQLRGVTPDVGFPTSGEALDFGESSFDNALPWSQIPRADYVPAGDVAHIVPRLVAAHDKRIAQDRDFQYLKEDIAEVDKMRRENVISLNEAERRKMREVRDARDRARGKNGNGANQDSADDGMLPGERKLSTELALEKARKNAPDILLREAAHVVSDEAGMLPGSALAVGRAAR